MLLLATNSLYSGIQLTQPEATLTAGIIVFVGTILAFIASLLNRRSIDRATNLTHAREVRSDQQDRFTKIAEQLAGKDEPIQLAGVYGLAGLADEWQEAENVTQRNVCVELLCAFLRAHDVHGESEAVKKAIISAIRSHCQKNAQYKWPPNLIDVSGVDLSHANLRGVDFSGVDLSGTNFTRTDLQESDFTHAQLYQVNFGKSNLQRAKFVEASLIQVGFQEADNRRAEFTRAKIWGGDFRKAHCHWATFRETALGIGTSSADNLMGANFSEAKLLGVDFSGANMTSAFFGNPEPGEWAIFTRPCSKDERTNHKYVEFETVRMTDFTKWPSGFDVKEVAARQLSRTSPPNAKPPTNLG